LEVFEGLNLVSISRFLFILLIKSELILIFTSPVATLPHRPPEAYAMCSVRIMCNASIYPFYINLYSPTSGSKQKHTNI